MKRFKIIVLAVSVLALIAWGTHRAWLWDVFLENTSDQACEKPLFGYSVVYCLPNAKAARDRCEGGYGCGAVLWCDCAGAPKPAPWYSYSE